MKERVHFYSADDLSTGLYLERLEYIFDTYKSGQEYNDINDVIELWHCKQFIETSRFNRWDEAKCSQYQKIAKECVSDIVNYLKTLEKETFLSAFKTLDYDYQRTIFDVFNKVAPFFLTEDILQAILLEKPHLIRVVLQGQHLVKRWSMFITEFLKKYDSTAELLLSQFVEKLDCEQKDLIFPKNFSLSERDNCISEYCDRPNANINYVRLALVSKDCEGLKLTPKTRLKAKRTADRLNADIFKGGHSSIVSTQIGCSIEGGEYKYNRPIVTEHKETDEGFSLMTHIRRDYIVACDNASIIYNFPLFFEWFNEQGYSTLVSNPNGLSLFEVIGLQAQNTYPVGMTFQHFNNLAIMQLMSTQQVLNDEGRSLEAAIKDFYENYLKKCYNYPAPKITIPSQDTDYVTRLRGIMPEMDALVKHYDTFVENGEIDLELIAISKPLSVAKGRSLLEVRNVYASSDRNCVIHSICRLLFSDQSSLSYVRQNDDSRYRTLFDTMRHRNVNYDLLHNHQQKAVDFLVEQNVLLINNERILCFSDMNLLLVLFYLWKYQVISYWECTEDIRFEIERMIEKGWIESDDFLLSRQEQDWFSYYLNKNKFTNGPEIRNIFEHGANTMYSEEQMQIMYYQVLMLFITLLYKIDLDLRLAIAVLDTMKK